MHILIYPSRTFHLIDRQPRAYNELNTSPALTNSGDPRSPHTPEHLIVEVDPDYLIDNTYKSVVGNSGSTPYIGGSAVPRITLINAQPETRQLILTRSAIAGDSYLPREIEIRGFASIYNDAFVDVRNLVSLNIDTVDDDTGEPWELRFAPGVNPTGTGFTIIDR